eukprot:Awhi_evm1s12342
MSSPKPVPKTQSQPLLFSLQRQHQQQREQPQPQPQPPQQQQQKQQNHYQSLQRLQRYQLLLDEISKNKQREEFISEYQSQKFSADVFEHLLIKEEEENQNQKQKQNEHEIQQQQQQQRNIQLRQHQQKQDMYSLSRTKITKSSSLRKKVLINNILATCAPQVVPTMQSSSQSLYNDSYLDDDEEEFVVDTDAVFARFSLPPTEESFLGLDDLMDLDD